MSDDDELEEEKVEIDESQKDNVNPDHDQMIAATPVKSVPIMDVSPEAAPVVERPVASMSEQVSPQANEISESLEDSHVQSESIFDEEHLRNEEKEKLCGMFSKREKNTLSASGSKVKLPYQMLINKLVDGLETPDIIRNKCLPMPTGIDSEKTGMQAIFDSPPTTSAA